MSRSLEARQARAGIALAAPALLLIAGFFLLPVAASLLLSLTDFDIYAIANRDQLRVVGLANYLALARDSLFWRALLNTAVFVVVATPLSIAVSLTAALLVTAAAVRLAAVFRTLFFVPVVTSLVAVAVVWRYLYHPRFGLLNYGLGLLGVAPHDWLGDPHLALPAIILLAVWKNFGFNMVVFMAGLQSIRPSLYEAASVDGAGRWAQFRRVTVPMLRPTTVFVTLMTLIGNFQLFAEPYIMTRGGPSNRTLSVVLYMYEQGFRWWNLGYAAALAFVLFAIILAVSMVARPRGATP
ncbi:MAG TPA: sugar ABC transporter permease [Candidatus Dormibacteraeota bacterium]|nr:sugar ABC transporter permease [Candidatus Dormibacteraeota bacterium]